MKKLRMAIGLAGAASAAVMLVSTPAFAGTGSVIQAARASASASASTSALTANSAWPCGPWELYCVNRYRYRYRGFGGYSGLGCGRRYDYDNCD